MRPSRNRYCYILLKLDTITMAANNYIVSGWRNTLHSRSIAMVGLEITYTESICDVLQKVRRQKQFKVLKDKYMMSTHCAKILLDSKQKGTRNVYQDF